SRLQRTSDGADARSDDHGNRVPHGRNVSRSGPHHISERLAEHAVRPQTAKVAQESHKSCVDGACEYDFGAARVPTSPSCEAAKRREEDLHTRGTRSFARYR